MIFTLEQDKATARKIHLKDLTLEDVASLQDGMKRDEEGKVSNFTTSMIRLAKNSIIKLEGYSNAEFSETLFVDTYKGLLGATNALSEIGVHLFNSLTLSSDEVKN